MNLTEQAAKLTELRAEIIALAERDGDLPEQDAARYAEALTEFDTLKADHDESWTRAAEYAVHEQAVRGFEAGAYESGDSIRDRGAPNVIVGDKDPYDERYQRDVGTREAALRAIGECRHIDGDGKTEAERKLRLSQTDPEHMRGFDKYLLKHNSDAYSSAFFKLTSGRGWLMDDAEKRAVMDAERYDTERGISLTAANGGALIPAHLDPTVILDNVGTSNPYRRISRVVPMMTNVWNGVTSAGITMAWSTEGGDSSDVAPTFGQPTITAAKAHGTVPVSIESFEDIQGLGSEIAREIADAKDRLEATAFTKGSGSGQPVGIVTTVNAETSRRTAFATNSAFTATDLINIQNAVGPRFQQNASWIASLTYLNRVRALGSSSYSTWTTKLDEAVADRILGKPAYEVSDLSTGLSTITAVGFVYGDFSNYLIADRVGMAVEFVPLLVSAGNVLPNGRRGWYCYWRVGADATTNTAFTVGHVPGA